MNFVKSWFSGKKIDIFLLFNWIARYEIVSSFRVLCQKFYSQWEWILQHDYNIRIHYENRQKTKFMREIGNRHITHPSREWTEFANENSLKSTNIFSVLFHLHFQHFNETLYMNTSRWLVFIIYITVYVLLFLLLFTHNDKVRLKKKKIYQKTNFLFIWNYDVNFNLSI